MLRPFDVSPNVHGIFFSNFIYFTTITYINHARWHRCLRSDGLLRVGGNRSTCLRSDDVRVGGNRSTCLRSDDVRVGGNRSTWNLTDYTQPSYHAVYSFSTLLISTIHICCRKVFY